MKTVHIPGIGDVKGSWVLAGGGVMAGVVGLAYYKARKAKAANAAAAASAVGNTTADSAYADTSMGAGAIDPSTGLPYAEEIGSYGQYGGIDPSTGLPYAYENYSNYGNTTSTTTITTNSAWVTQAEQDAQVLYGATEALAVSAVGKYMSQTTQGLNGNEYLLMQEIIAELGTPPQGGPYRLIQAPNNVGTPTPTGGGTKSLKTGNFSVNIPIAVTPPKTVASVAKQFGVSVQHLLDNNPGLTASAENVVINLPVAIAPGTTFQSLSTRFSESVSSLEAALAKQGVTA